MKEKDMQTMFGKWLMSGFCYINEPSVFELKIVNCSKQKKPFVFDAVKEHQKQALLSAKHTKLYHKISDSFIGTKTGEVRFPTAKPFDCLLFSKAKSYVVIWFYTPRTPKKCFIIDVDAFITIQNTFKRKSIQESELDAYLTQEKWLVNKVLFWSKEIEDDYEFIK